MERTKIFTVLKKHMRDIIDNIDEKQQIQEEQSMIDFGADSLEIIEIVSRTMKELKIKIPRTKLVGPQNIHQLLDFFEECEK